MKVLEMKDKTQAAMMRASESKSKMSEGYATAAIIERALLDYKQALSKRRRHDPRMQRFLRSQ